MEDKKYLLVLSKISNRYKALQHVSTQRATTSGRVLPLVVASGAPPLLVAPDRPPLVVASGRPPLPPLSHRPVKLRQVSRSAGTRPSGKRFVVK